MPRRLPSGKSDDVVKPSAVNLDPVESVSIGLLSERFGALSPSRMDQVRAALTVATGCG